MWSRVLANIDKINTSIQRKSVFLDKASKMLKCLTKSIKTICDKSIDLVLNYGKQTADVIGIESNCLDKRIRKNKSLLSFEIANDDEYFFIHEQDFKREIND